MNERAHAEFNGADVKIRAMGSLHTLDREAWPTTGDWVNDHNGDAILPFPLRFSRETLPPCRCWSCHVRRDLGRLRR
jgi:hypothetical protein